MIRTGIHKLSQVKDTELQDLFGRDRNISINIYSQLSSLSDSSLYEKYSEIILNRFNTNANAIKRTYRNRFNAFDNMSIQIIKESKIPELKIHDMAISDGRASCYLLQNLIKNVPKLKYTGSDLAVSYNFYEFDKDKTGYVITDENGDIIEITKPPFVWNVARKEGRMYFLNNFLKNHYLKKFKEALRACKLVKTKKIVLADEEYVRLLESNDGFKIINYNLFEKNVERFNIIRVMNILHYGYFKEEQLNLILRNIFSSLLNDGLFIEGSNEDPGSPVQGAIYKKTHVGFELVTEGEKPSRIQKCVLNFKYK